MLYKSSKDIEQVEDSAGLNDEDWPRVAQVKEKFGSLRFYVRIGGENNENGKIASVQAAADQIWSLVSDAEIESHQICESCGNAGVLRCGGWWRVLCQACDLINQSRTVI